MSAISFKIKVGCFCPTIFLKLFYKTPRLFKAPFLLCLNMTPLHPCIFMSKFPFIFIYIDIDILYLNNTLIFWIFLHEIFTKSIIINGIIKSVYNLSYIYYNTIYLFSIVFVLLIIENQYFFIKI